MLDMPSLARRQRDAFRSIAVSIAVGSTTAVSMQGGDKGSKPGSEDSIKAPDRTIWAAYVLGYDVQLLHHEAGFIWHNRIDILERHIPLPGGVQSKSAQEVSTAIELIVDARICDADIAMRLARSIERWKQAYEIMTWELTDSSAELSQLDWNSHSPPGVGAWRELKNVVRVALERDSLLEAWKEFGEWFWGVCLDSLLPSNNSELVARLQKLNEHGEFPFIAEIIAALDLKVSCVDELPAGMSRRLFNEFSNQITPKLLETCLRECLYSNTKLEPWLILNGEKVEFLGRNVKLSPAHLGMLRFLAETPRFGVTRFRIVAQAQLRCGPEGLPLLVSRLRNKLRPAIEARFTDPSTKPDGWEHALIVGLRDGTDTYQLEIARARVLLLGPRPNSMKPLDAENSSPGNPK